LVEERGLRFEKKKFYRGLGKWLPEICRPSNTMCSSLDLSPPRIAGPNSLNDVSYLMVYVVKPLPLYKT
jgi:hypothetical protein